MMYVCVLVCEFVCVVGGVELQYFENPCKLLPTPTHTTLLLPLPHILFLPV